MVSSGPLDGVANGARVTVDLIVVAARGGLVAEEVNSGVLDAAGLLGLVFEVRQAEGLVPAGREHVERDLTADREPARALLVCYPRPKGPNAGIKKTYVNPKCPNRSLSFSTKAWRT